MPTREELSKKIDRDLADRGLRPNDPQYDFVRQSLESMNQGMADLDDELADLSKRLQWLLNAATWTSERPSGQFEPFVESKLRECETSLRDIRARWSKHLSESPKS